MARTYLVFDDIEGKLDVLRVARGPLPTQGPLSRLLQQNLPEAD
jgi:hypothetical protein